MTTNTKTARTKRSTSLLDVAFTTPDGFACVLRYQGHADGFPFYKLVAPDGAEESAKRELCRNAWQRHGILAKRGDHRNVWRRVR